MKVHDPNWSGVSPESLGGAGLERPEQTQAADRRRVGAGEKGAGEAADRVSLSALSSRLRALNVDSPERASRLEKLSVEVREVRYRTDAMELSRRLIDEAMKPPA